MMAPMQKPADRAPQLAYSEALGHGLADRRIAVLRHIGEGGSISQAACRGRELQGRLAGAGHPLTNLAGVPLVERLVGGAGGGGARLTDAGRQLLAAAHALEAARSAALARIAPATGGQALGGLAVRTSMRNQWPCVVQAVQVHGPLVQVQLQGDGAAAHALACGRASPAKAPNCWAWRRPAGAGAVQGHGSAGGGAGAGRSAAVRQCLAGACHPHARGAAGDEVSAQIDAGCRWWFRRGGQRPAHRGACSCRWTNRPWCWPWRPGLPAEPGRCRAAQGCRA